MKIFSVHISSPISHITTAMLLLRVKILPRKSNLNLTQFIIFILLRGLFYKSRNKEGSEERKPQTRFRSRGVAGGISFVVLSVQCEALQGEWRFFEERSSASCFRSQCQRSRQFSRFKLIVFGGGVEPREDFQEVQTFFAGMKVLGSRMIHRQR